MNPALWKKNVGEVKWFLLISAVGMFLFCIMRIWIMSQIEPSRFANVVAQFWSDVERFSPVPLAHLLTYAGRIAVGFEELIILVLISMWSIARGSDCVSGEVERGTMEMLLAQPVSRLQVLCTQSTVTVTGIAVLVLAAWLGVFTGVHTFSVLREPPQPGLTIPLTSIKIPLPGPRQEPVQVPMSELVDVTDVIPAALNLFTLGFFLAGMTAFLSSWDRYRWRTIGIAVGISVVQLMLKVLSRAHDSLEWLKFGTFYTAFEPQAAVYVALNRPDQLWHLMLTDESGRWIGLAPLGDNLILVCLGLSGFIAASVIFSRRDLPAPL